MDLLKPFRYAKNALFSPHIPETGVKDAIKGIYHGARDSVKNVLGAGFNAGKKVATAGLNFGANLVKSPTCKPKKLAVNTVKLPASAANELSNPLTVGVSRAVEVTGREGQVVGNTITHVRNLITGALRKIPLLGRPAAFAASLALSPLTVTGKVAHHPSKFIADKSQALGDKIDGVHEKIREKVKITKEGQSEPPKEVVAKAANDDMEVQAKAAA